MRSKTWISVLILLVLGLHAVPVLSYQGARQTRWPFLAWAMYARSYPPGPIVVTMRRMMATSASGREEPVTSAMAGLPEPTFRNGYLAPLWRGDSTPASDLIQRLNRGRTDPIVQLRLEGEQFTLVDSGVVKQPIPVVTVGAPAPAGQGAPRP